jgi:hypothetical protein
MEVGRIGWMSGGNSARWNDEEMGDIYLNKVTSFIKDNKNKPFFLCYASHENHVPRIPHPRFKGSTVANKYGIPRSEQELKRMAFRMAEE